MTFMRRTLVATLAALALGDFQVGIKIHADVRPEIVVHVVKE